MPERHCIHHADRPAIGNCFQCHKPLCEDCNYDAPTDGIFCDQVCYDRYVAYQGRRKPAYKGSPLRKVVSVLIALAVLAAAIYVGGGMGIPVLKDIRDAIMSRTR